MANFLLIFYIASACIDSYASEHNMMRNFKLFLMPALMHIYRFMRIMMFYCILLYYCHGQEMYISLIKQKRIISWD